ncbi:MAG: hypothetical protein JRI72_06745 [Deltaproteobacteria bacterium]|nr:hypothetical protein [Deltaproteobacteria bacterium]
MTEYVIHHDYGGFTIPEILKEELSKDYGLLFGESSLRLRSDKRLVEYFKKYKHSSYLIVDIPYDPDELEILECDGLEVIVKRGMIWP